MKKNYSADYSPEYLTKSLEELQNEYGKEARKIGGSIYRFGNPLNDKIWHDVREL